MWTPSVTWMRPAMCGPSSAPRNSRNTTSGMGLFGMADAMSGAASATRKMTNSEENVATMGILRESAA